MSKALDRIVDALSRHKRMFDMRVIGEDLCHAFADGCYNALMSQKDYLGRPLAPLTPGYRRWKERNYPGHPIGILEFEMAQYTHFRNEVIAKRDEAAMRYGRTEEAQDEFAWFNEGNPPTQAPRPVWGMTAQAEQNIREILTRHLRDNI
jgi:hypothetical protein